MDDCGNGRYYGYLHGDGNMSKDIAIETKGLSVGYGDYVLLHDADYQVNKGDIFTKEIINRKIINVFRCSLSWKLLKTAKKSNMLIITKINKFIDINLLIPIYFEIFLIKFAVRFLIKSYIIKNKYICTYLVFDKLSFSSKYNIIKGK